MSIAVMYVCDMRMAVSNWKLSTGASRISSCTGVKIAWARARIVPAGENIGAVLNRKRLGNSSSRRLLAAKGAASGRARDAEEAQWREV